MNDERPGGPIRIGDKEREDAVKRLGEHYEAGRLSAEEHTERVGQALEAKTGADLAALFADLPGAHQAGADGTAAGAETGGGGEGWAGPWGWAKPPWTAPDNAAGGPSRPAWAARGPLGRIPWPVLLVVAVIGVLLSIGCVVAGGHPPVLPLLLIVAGLLILRKRRQEQRA